MKKHFTLITISILSLLFFVSTQAQQIKRTNNWFFGANAGLHFTSGYPQSASGGQTPQLCGSTATISDTNGNLLFYSEGENVWNRNHQLMPNGLGILGERGSSQPALIIPMPGSDSLYYLFTTDGVNSALTYGLRYSIIDISLDNGLGDVTTTKNVKLLQPVSQKISAVYHANGTDYWLVTHHWGSDTFYAYQISAAGISAPVRSKAGSYHTGGHQNSMGYLKLAHDGKKLAVTTYSKDLCEIFDFDNATGIVSNPIPVSISKALGLEFSPDNTKLYISNNNGKDVFQVDMDAGADTSIINSLTLIGSSKPVSPFHHSGANIAALQLGLDGRIYCAHTSGLSTEYKHLDVIMFPDSANEKCQFKNNYIYLNYGYSSIGLPGFVQSYLNNIPVLPTPTISGRVKLEDTGYYSGKVYLYENSFGWRVMDSTTFDTTNSGYFEFPHMNTLDYKLLAILDTNSINYNNYIPTYYGDVDIIDSAKVFSNPGTYDINMISRISIKGKVIADMNSQGKVYLYKEDINQNYVLTDSNDFGIDGKFGFPRLLKGNYKLLATLDVQSTGYSYFFPTYYGDENRMKDGLVINSITQDIEIRMLRKMSISGQIMVDSHNYGVVYLLEKDTSGWKTIDSFGFQYPGQFSFGPLLQKEYTLLAVLNQNSPSYNDYYDTYFGDVINADSAAIIDTVAINIQINLVPRLMIKGQIMVDSHNYGMVYLLEKDTSGWRIIDTFGFQYPGQFSFGPLPKKKYTLLAVLNQNSPSYNDYYDTYFGDVINADSATIIDTVAINIQINLVPKLMIKGKVFAGTYDFGTVFLYRIDSLNNYYLIDSVVFDTSGRYRFSYFNPGNYLLYAVLDTNSPNYADYAPTYYGNVVQWAYATIVNSSGSGYDIHMYYVIAPMAGPGSIRGRTVKNLRSSDYINAPNILVMLLDDGGAVRAYRYSDANGSFAFTNLPYGSYHVHVELTGTETHDLALKIDQHNIAYTNLIIQINSIGSAIRYDQENMVVFGLPAPNPFHEFVTLSVKANREYEIEVGMKNILGQSVLNSMIHIPSGENIIPVASGHLGQGIYILTLRDRQSGELILTHKLLKN